MKIKYSPICEFPETHLEYINEWAIRINGENYEFSPEMIEYPDVCGQTNGVITEAHITDGELFLTIPYFYGSNRAIWENGNYYPGGGYRGSQYEDFGKDAIAS